MPDNQLHDAAEKGDLEEVKKLIKEGYDVNAEHSQHGTYPIYSAAINGHFNIVQYLLDKCNANYNEKGCLLFWIMHCNDQEKRIALLSYLFEKKLKFTDGTTQAHIAAALGNIEFFNGNLEQLGIQNRYGVTPLFYAIITNQTEILKIKEENKLSYSPIVMNWEVIDSKVAEDWRNLARFLFILGFTLFKQRNLEEAQENYTKAIEAMNHIEVSNRTDGDWRNLASMLFKLGRTLYNQKNHEEAQAANEKAIEATDHIEVSNRTDGDWRNLSANYNNLGSTLASQKKWEEAQENYTKAIEATDHIEVSNRTDVDWRNLASMLFNLGRTLYNQKNHEEAQAANEKAIEAMNHIEVSNRTDDDWRNLGASYNNLSNIHMLQKEWKEVQENCTKMIEAMNHIEVSNRTDSDWRNLASTFSNLGGALYNQKNLEEGQAASEKAIEASNKIEESIRSTWDWRNLASMLFNLGETLYNQKNHKETQAAYEKAIVAWFKFTFNEPDEKDKTCEWSLLKSYYKAWNLLYLTNGIGCDLTRFAMNIFNETDQNAEFANDGYFYRIYSEISNPTNWQHSTHFIKPLVQLMEIILQGHQSSNFPNTPFKDYLQKAENLSLFEEKLKALKEQEYLFETLAGTNQSMLVAVEKEIDSLNQRNKELDEKSSTTQEELGKIRNELHETKKELCETKTTLKEVLDELKALKSQFEEKSSSPSYYDGGQTGNFFGKPKRKPGSGLENNRSLKSGRIEEATHRL